MQARLFYAFATELLKTAADLPDDLLDADIRELYAERRGDEKYFPGGQLPSNSIADQQGQEYGIKLGEAINISSGVYDFKSKKKKKNLFQKLRDYGAAGAKGAFVGLGAVEAHRKLKGIFEKPTGARASKRLAKNFQIAAAVGAGLSMLERAYRHDDIPAFELTKKEKKKTAMVARTAGLSAFRSPAKELADSRRVGMFESVDHMVGKPPRVPHLRGKF